MKQIRLSDTFLTPKQVMDTMGWKTTFYYEQRKKGLPTIKVGAKVRHPESLVENWLGQYLLV